MDFFIDTGVVEDVKDLVPWGLVDGVTTNPSLIAKSGRKREDVILEMCEIQKGPVSAEVISTDFQGMVSEGKELASLHPQIVIKLPLIEDGLKACAKFTEDEIKTNVTLCFSSPQALLAAKCGATYISPFLGRLDDIGHDGMALINEIRTIYDNFGYTTQILAASLRHSTHVREAALLGADVATCPPNVIKALIKHPLTDRGLEQFLADHAKSKQ